MTGPAALRCPSCSAPVRAADLDLGRGIATCASCGAVMTLGSSAGGASGSDFRRRPPVPLPPHVQVETLPDGVEIRRRWFAPAVLLMAFFCVFWDGFLVVWYSLAFTGKAPLFAVLFPLLHVAVGVGLTYGTLAGIFNTTFVRVAGGSLSIAHRPFRWPGNRVVDAATVDQLWCKDVVRNGRNGPSHSYEVWMTSTDDRSSKLVAAGLESQQALFIEQQLESALGIRDREVAGEMAR